MLEQEELLTVREAAAQIGLSDRQATGAGLELTDLGFDHTVLCEFRLRLVVGDAKQRLLDTLLA
jgi:hypothetical protein